MRIANITEEARWGGPQVRIANVASELEKYDVSTTVVHPSMNASRFVEELQHLGIDRREGDIYRLTRDASILLKYIIHFPREIYYLIRIFREIKPDLVHCNGCWQIKGMLAAWLCGIPAVWHLNDTHTPKSVRVVFRFLAQFLADGFILASERTRDYYLKNTNLSSLPSSVIQAPVNTEEFDPDTVQPNSEISSLNGFKVATVATVNPLKGIEDFIDMGEKVHERLSGDAHFFVVGPIHDSQRQYGQQLQSRAEHSTCNIHFTGHSDEVPRILKAADLYVCSSKFEASPISVWEAMSMELPIVSTDVGDLCRFLEEQGRPAGAVVEVGSSRELADEVLQLLRDKELRAKYGENARKIAQQQLSLESCARKHKDIYEDVAKL